MKQLSNAVQKRFDDYIDLSIRRELLVPPHYFDTNTNKYSLDDVKMIWHDGILASSKVRHDALYIHIPFCISRCSFCMYDSQMVHPEHISSYICRILKEFDYWKDEIREPLDSLYIGGGTPSVMSSNDIKSLFKRLNKLSFIPNSSRTFELSPETASEEKIIELGHTVINRVSIGVQSLDEEVLKRVNRNNISRTHIKNLISVARTACFDDINIDLMVGLDGQDERNIRTTIEQIIDMNPLSVTLYTFRDVRKIAKRNASERMDDVNKQLHSAFKSFQDAGWLHKAGDIDTEYNIFYSMNPLVKVV